MAVFFINRGAEPALWSVMDLGAKPDWASPAANGGENIDKKNCENAIKEQGAGDVAQGAEIGIEDNQAYDDADCALDDTGEPM